MQERITLTGNEEVQRGMVDVFPGSPTDQTPHEDWTSGAAREISEYLLIGWHHNTETGRAAIASIITKHYRARFAND